MERAWGAALTLVAMILMFTLLARLLARRSRLVVTDLPSRPRDDRRSDPVTGRRRQRTRHAAPSRTGAPARQAPQPSARRQVALSDLNAFYGEQHGGEGRRPRLRGQQGHGDHRPVRLRQVDAGALHQPHARGDPGRPRRGRGRCSTRGHLRRRRRRRSPCGGDRHGLPEAEPVPDDVDLRQRRRRPAPDGPHGRQPRTSVVERALRGAGLWDEVKDRLDQPGQRRCRAASSSACASPARSRSSPR